jgi:hypothetical protein
MATRNVNFRFEEDLDQALAATAAREGTTRTAIVKEALELRLTDTSHEEERSGGETPPTPPLWPSHREAA